MTRLIVFLATIGIFTLLGIVVGYLIASSILGLKPQPQDAAFMISIAYTMCSIGGLVAGLVISCFGVWLLGKPGEK